MKRIDEDERGWSNIEAMAAVLIAVIALGSLAAAAVDSTVGSRRLRERAAALMETRNGESDATLELIGR